MRINFLVHRYVFMKKKSFNLLTSNRDTRKLLDTNLVPIMLLIDKKKIKLF